MTSKISFNKSNFVNKSPLFNGEQFIIWEVRMKMCLNVDFNSWDYVLDGPFIPTHYVNNEIVNKPRHL